MWRGCWFLVVGSEEGRSRASNSFPTLSLCLTRTFPPASLCMCISRRGARCTSTLEPRALTYALGCARPWSCPFSRTFYSCLGASLLLVGVTCLLPPLSVCGLSTSHIPPNFPSSRLDSWIPLFRIHLCLIPSPHSPPSLSQTRTGLR